MAADGDTFVLGGESKVVAPETTVGSGDDAVTTPAVTAPTDFSSAADGDSITIHSSGTKFS